MCVQQNARNHNVTYCYFGAATDPMKQTWNLKQKIAVVVKRSTSNYAVISIKKRLFAQIAKKDPNNKD